MWKACIAWSAAIALLGAYSAANSLVTLRPEEPSILHVGDIAEVRLATVYRYRAVTAGNHTLVLTPRDPGPDGCVSCVTVHYFIQVAK